MIIRRKTSLIVALLILLNCAQSFATGLFATGEEWLTWSNDARQGYVSAYVLAYSRGFRDGCQTGQQTYSAEKASGLLEEKCFGKVHKFSRHLENYAETITRYYHAYPGDRDVPIFKLIEGLADERKLSIERMHEYYGLTQK